jgi:hypothetical protein
VNSPCVDRGDSSTIYNDLPDPNNPSNAKYPSRGTLRNDMGAYGGPLSKILANSIIGIINLSGTTPGSYELMQNYPNPFNPVTIIRFNVAANSNHEFSNVKLVIYDISGKQVVVLVNRDLKPGTYEVDFNADGLSSGVYFYKLITNEIQITRKMVLAK